jgi:hypothetical protein
MIQMVKKDTLHELLVLPERDEREETPEFRQTKKTLREDGHWKCFICGCEDNLEVHHFGCEYSLRDNCNFDKLKIFCEIFDPYGYGEKLKDTTMTSVDDVRNALMLCRNHHLSSDGDGVANGIHNLSFPVWIAQLVCHDVVPNNTEELNKLLEKKI